MAVRVDQTRDDPTVGEDGFGAVDRLHADGAVDDPVLHRLLIGEPAAGNVECQITSAPGSSAWTGRNRPAPAAVRRAPPAAATGRGIRPACPPARRDRKDPAPWAESGPASCPSCLCRLWLSHSYGWHSCVPSRAGP